MDLMSANAVIAARGFTPSVLSQLWLVRNNVIPEDEFQSGCIFTDAFAQVESSRLMLIALPDRLQIAPKLPTDAEAVQNVLGKIVTSLPNSLYTAIGLNFIWHFQPLEESMAALTRRLFFPQAATLSQEFSSEDSHFGAYLSKAYGKMRLKLDIKPIFIQWHGSEAEHRLQFSFNFHLDLNVDAVPAIIESANQWTNAFELAQRIAAETVNDHG